MNIAEFLNTDAGLFIMGVGLAVLVLLINLLAVRLLMSNFFNLIPLTSPLSKPIQDFISEGSDEVERFLLTQAVSATLKTGWTTFDDDLVKALAYQAGWDIASEKTGEKTVITLHKISLDTRPPQV